MHLSKLRTASDVQEKLREIFGEDLREKAGTVHVTAVWEETPGRYLTLKINPDTPRSPHDFFLLNAIRARADAIVTTGKILREEADLTHDIQGPPNVVKALREWRRDIVGLEAPAISLVLTSGRGLDLDHPLFHSSTAPLIYTSTKGAEVIRPRIAATATRLAWSERSSLEGAIDYLRDEFDIGTIAIEAGPSTSAALYRSPPQVEELILSVYGGGHLPARVKGLPFVDAQQLERIFPSRSRPFAVEEPSGPWVFRRMRTRIE